ncbi:MAG: hypothetical protein HC895_03055 [Leptolyngbyaceae cyanobacterium SM1_3_5]|nr:hypothetical protein [Leptolyngbyaceae cyanobacterium SM1_3_5]
MQAWSKSERRRDRLEVKPCVGRFGISRLEARASVFAQGVVDYWMALAIASKPTCFKRKLKARSGWKPQGDRCLQLQ